MIQQLALVEPDLMDRFEVDVRSVLPCSSASSKIAVGDLGGYTCFRDEFGIGWKKPKDGGWYYDMFDHPWKDQITDEDVAQFSLPDPCDPARFAGLRERVIGVHGEDQRAVVLGNISAGIFEMFTWTRGYEDAFSDWAGNQPLARKIMDRFLQ